MKMKMKMKKNAGEKSHQDQGLPDDLVFEVLTRVERVKYLHQYKCVSKAWHSIIAAPRFFEAYGSHHQHRGGILVSMARHLDKENKKFGGVFREPPVEVRFLYSTLLLVSDEEEDKTEPEPFFCRLKVPISNYFRGYTEVVNGLVCIYDINDSVIVCNVCTGETMRLPSMRKLSGRNSKCFLGYDPASRLYKLLCLFIRVRVGAFATSLADGLALYDSQLECEILTLGRDSSWRKLVPLQNRGVLQTDYGIFVLVNGVMYWKISCGYEDEDDPRLVSFDVNKEKFRSIKPPQDRLELHHNAWYLVHFGGRPALSSFGIAGGGPRLIEFRVLEDDEGDSWIKHSILLPAPRFPFDAFSWDTVPVGNLPTGQILFAVVSKSDCYFTHVYSYDHQNNKFERLLVGGNFFQNPPPSCSGFRYTCIQENVAPLQVLLNGGEL